MHESGRFKRFDRSTMLNNRVLIERRFSRLVDLDHFKKINDMYGHSVGDEALIAVSESLAKSFRNNDEIYRYGGEEFLAALPETDASSAAMCAERCRIAIGELDLSAFGVKTALSASFGVAQLGDSENSMIDLLDRADVALSNAKQEGRNRTVLNPVIMNVDGVSVDFGAGSTV